MESVERGETIRLEAQFKDRDAAAQDPTISQLIRIVHEETNAIVVADAAMTDWTVPSTVAGGWIYKYKPAANAALGVYIAQGIGNDGATPDTSFGRVEFLVVKRLGT